MAKIKLEDLKYIGVQLSEEVENKLEDIENEEIVIYDEKVNTEDVARSVIKNNVENTVVSVKNIKIFAKPSLKLPAKCYTGNIEIIGHVDMFDIVKYIKPGFGPVKGYTTDLNHN